MLKARYFWFSAASALAACGLLISSCATATEIEDEDDNGSGEPPPPAIKPLTAVPGLEITEIALYQGIKRPLALAGQSVTSTIPVIAGRASVLRIFVGGQVPANTPLTARLYIGASKPIEVTRNLTVASTDAVYDSTINFELPGNGIAVDMTYRIELGQVNSTPQGAPGPLTYPAMGSEAIPVIDPGGGLEIKLVPVAYNADGSGRLPDTSEEQLKVYKDGFYAMYPIPEITITVREPFMWEQPIENNGFGWDELLSAISQLRTTDQSPGHVYYYGVFAPATSEGQFCAGGCVLGLGMLGPGAYARAAIGLGYPGATSLETALHEVGHNHGRNHSGCGTESDPGYPTDVAHQGGLDGVWGNDLFTKTMYPPTHPDIMGYCVPLWISDYTFKALLDVVVAVNKEPMARLAGPIEPVVYERIGVDGEGKLKWLPPVTLDSPPAAPGTPTREVKLESATAQESTVGHFFAYDHLPGGVLLVRQPTWAYKAMAVNLGGRVVRLQR